MNLPNTPSSQERRADIVSRRDFHKLSMAALGGVVAGTLAGCGKKDDAGSTPAPQADLGAPGESGTVDVAQTEGLHACRGMNECKGQGAGGDNACAGQGTCASAAARHSCAGENACKGLGGCGTTAGTNDCKGMGGCSVPMHEGAWEQARAAFEKRMQEAGKEFGPAPEAS